MELKTQFFSRWPDYFTLCKPRVVSLMMVTVLVGMYLSVPGWVPMATICFALIGIAFCASSAAAINHLLDKRIDAIMARTQNRPVAHGRISVQDALIFALVLGFLGMMDLCFLVNYLTAALTFISSIGYAVIYTGYLKRATPQNIVIGGLAGAAPPLLGWTAVTNQLDPQALLLVLIIFTWTPPHFWALAIYRLKDYQKAEIPMLPVTHGVHFTKLSVLLYTILLLLVSLLPFLVGMSGLIYCVAALLLGLRFVYFSWALYYSEDLRLAMQTFRYSIVYLLLLFVFILIDHYYKI